MMARLLPSISLLAAGLVLAGCANGEPPAGDTALPGQLSASEPDAAKAPVAPPPVTAQQAAPADEIPDQPAVPEAAAQDDPEALFALGMAHLGGDGVAQDDNAAARLLLASAEAGHPGAQHYLGLMHLAGRGVPQDDAAALRWLTASAGQGESEARNRLGGLYAEGRGVPRDMAQAVRWIRVSAEQGNPQAQQNLGTFYANGEGVPQDYAEAERWFRAAAEQDRASAQYLTGVLHAEGKGVPADPVQAFKWMSLAARHGDQPVIREHAILAQEALARTMTQEQIAEAEALAQAWRPRQGESPR